MNKEIKKVRNKLLKSNDPHLVYMGQVLDDNQIQYLLLAVKDQQQIEMLEGE